MANPEFNFFGATFQDVLDRRQTLLSDYDSLFGEGNGKQIIEDHMERNENRILAFLPGEIQKKLTKIEGEILVLRSRGDETTVTLGLGANVTNLILYRNPTALLRELRKGDELESSAFSESGGVVTFTPSPREDDLIIASYNHTFVDFKTLKDLVVDLTGFWLDIANNQENISEIEISERFLLHAEASLRGLATENPDFSLTLRELAKMDFYEGGVHRKTKKSLLSGEILRS